MERDLRLLLLEFVFEERCRNDKTHYFPFYQGLARSLGAECRWLFYGTDYRLDWKLGYYIELDEEDRLSLEHELEEFAPTHIISGDHIEDATFEVIRQVVPDAMYLSMYEWLAADGYAYRVGTTPRPNFRTTSARIKPLTTVVNGMAVLSHDTLPFPWLLPEGADVEHGGSLQYLIDREPCYDAVAKNERAKSFDSFIRIFGGHHCTSRVPLASNPFLEGIDLSVLGKDVGCTFCSATGRIDPTKGFVHPPVEQSVAQLQRIIDTIGTSDRNMREYDIYNTWVFLELEEFFRTLFAIDFPPGTFHFSPRINDFLAKADTLERLLPELERRGHAINLVRMGMENFSPVEQLRFNKGITTAQAVRALERVDDFTERFPGVFSYDGLGFILFTPWTTFDDLDINFTTARECGLRVCGHVMTSTMQLDADTHMDALTKRDGLYLDEYDDPTLRYNTYRSYSWRATQRGWRFQDPFVAMISRTLVKYVAYADGSDPFEFFEEDDPHYKLVRALYDGLDSSTRRNFLYIGESLLAVARRLDDPDDLERIFTLLQAQLADPVWRRERWSDAQVVPYPTTATTHHTVASALLADNLDLLRTIFERLATSSRSPLPLWHLEHLEEHLTGVNYAIQATLRKGDRRLVLELLPPDAPDKGLVETPHLKLSHDSSTPLQGDHEAKRLVHLGKIIDHYLAKTLAT